MKKVLSIILLAAVVLSFAACSNTKPSSSSLTSGEIAQNEQGQSGENGSSEHDHDHDHTNSGSSASKNNGGANNSSTSSKHNATRPDVTRPTVIVEEKENITASAPEISVEEGAINRSWSIYFKPDDLSSSLNVDALSAGISIRETASGKLVASYAMIGYSRVFIDSITEPERYAIADSISYDWKYYYDMEKKQGLYFSWSSLNIDNDDKLWSYDDVMEEYKDILVDGEGFINLPSEIFGKRVIYQGMYVPCKYDTKTGKLEIEGKFPLKDIYIEGEVGVNKYKIDGKVYSFN